jgi:antitoxin ParD1/3/4
MKISLSPDVERLIAERVSSGRYHSADEVVREGLDLLQERENEAQRSPSNHAADLGQPLKASRGTCLMPIGKAYPVTFRRTSIAIFTETRKPPDGARIC